MKRAFAVLDIKAVDGDSRKFSGIATTPTADRVGDIVEPKGAQFKLPLPLLWQHNASDPIGWVTRAKVTDKGIEVEGEIAKIEEEGPLKDRLKTAWQMIKGKLVRGLSIGFNSIEHTRLEDSYSYRFLKWEWLELSAVTIPANQEATITAVKSAFESAAPGQHLPGVTGFIKGIGKMKTLREQLAELKEARQTKAARMGEIADSIKSESATSEEAAEFDSLESEISKLDNDIRIKTAECVNASKATPVTSRENPGVAPTGIVKSHDPDDKFKGQAYTRMVIAKAIAHLEGISPVAVAYQRGWHKTNPQLATLIKAAVEGGGSGSGEWGAELVSADNRFTGDFIEYLHGMTVFDKLPLREVPANVAIKGQDGAATGYWVGESGAIPASAQDFSSISLTPLKVAALAVVSNELLRDSSPAAEQLVRDALAEASAQRVDSTFFSTSAASAGVSPAGILNGVSAKSNNGTDGDAVALDLKLLYADFISNKIASGLHLVMNPALAKALSLMRNTLGQYEYPNLTQNGGQLMGDPVHTGDNVNSAHMILLRPSDIWKIGDQGVQVSISREATIEMDSAPAMESQGPTGPSGATVNMFQTESTAIKVVRPINFAKRRSTCVQYINDAAYGPAT